MRALILTDRKDWSYWSIAQALVKHNTDPDLTIDVMALKGHESEFLSVEKRYDRVLVMGWQMAESRAMRRALDGERWLTGVHSHHSFDSDLLTTPDDDVAPPWPLILFLRKFRGVNVVSDRLHRLFSDEKINNVTIHPEYMINPVYTPNGVDCEVFKPTAPLSTEGPLRVGFAGTAKGIHDSRKGYSEYVVPACCKAGCKLITAIARTETCLPPEQMPAFWNSVDVMLLPSSSEGFSIAALEAAACGRPVISTRVGGSTELIKSGTNGFLVERTVEAIADRLVWLQDNRDQLYLMGLEARSVAVAEWSWQHRAAAWLDFLRS